MNRGSSVYSDYWKARKEERYGDCLPILQKGVENNDPVAMWLLGCCYESGCFVKKSKDSAHELYKKSASLGNPKAMVHLASMSKHYEWAKKGFNSGDSYAIGYCYYYHLYGICDRDPDRMELESVAYFEKAWNDEMIIESLYLLGDYYDGYPIRNDPTAYEWFMKGALEGDAWCQFRIGLFYNITDFKKSAKWLKKTLHQHPDTYYMSILIEVLIQSQLYTEAWYWNKRYKNIKGVVCKNEEIFDRFDRCITSCHTLILVRNYRKSVLNVFPKDIVVMIAKTLWTTRESDEWCELGLG
jgi:TPR repeat protein